MTAAPRSVDRRGGRSLEELRFIRDRVLAEIRANPSTLPLLTEAPVATCKSGHADWGTRSDGQRYCRTCQKRAGRKGKR